MSKEEQELLDESYKDYFIKKSSETGPFGVAGIIPTKDEFINNCKNNPEFSERWGLKIEERELNTDERNKWFQMNLNGNNPLMKSDWKDYELDQQNIPTKVITITYNDTKIQSYE